MTRAYATHTSPEFSAITKPEPAASGNRKRWSKRAPVSVFFFYFAFVFIFHSGIFFVVVVLGPEIREGVTCVIASCYQNHA